MRNAHPAATLACFANAVALLLALMVGYAHESWAKEPIVSDLEPTRVLQSQSLTDDDNETATDISGIACMPGNGASRVCMVINDEDRGAQFVHIDGGSLVGGAKVPLIGKKPSDTTIGEEPQVAECSEGKAKFKDLDGEAVAFNAPFFYVSGSHGCTRHRNKFRTSSFIVARIDVDQQGRPGPVETTYRLADVLRTAPQIGEYFGKDLDGADGLNVEGIAVASDRLIVGLRAPVIEGKAFLVAVDLAHLFSRTSPPPPSNARVIPISLASNMGIRDLATIADSRLLLLTGPAQEQKDVPYGLFLVELASTKAPKYLATFKDVYQDGIRAKPEGAVVLDSTAGSLLVLVVFDSIPGGGPREYRVPIQ